VKQDGRRGVGDLGSTGASLRGLLIKLGQRDVSPDGDPLELPAELTALLSSGVEARLNALTALHHVEDDLLKVRLPASQRLDLGLQVLKLPRRADHAAVKSLPVAIDPCPDLLDVGLCLGLLPFNVAELRGHGSERVAQLRVAACQIGDLGMLRQA